MRLSLRPARSAVAMSAAALLLAGCELGLHEVQQATTGGCEPWQGGCPAPNEYTGEGPAPLARADLERVEMVAAAADAPYRPCNTIGLACQGRIIGDVLWDQYVMVLTGQSRSASTAASAGRAGPALEVKPAGPVAPAATAPSPVQPAAAPGRIVRTHGTRGSERPPLLPSAPPR